MWVVGCPSVWLDRMYDGPPLDDFETLKLFFCRTSGLLSFPLFIPRWYQTLLWRGPSALLQFPGVLHLRSGANGPHWSALLSVWLGWLWQIRCLCGVQCNLVHSYPGGMDTDFSDMWMHLYNVSYNVSGNIGANVLPNSVQFGPFSLRSMSTSDGSRPLQTWASVLNNAIKYWDYEVRAIRLICLICHFFICFAGRSWQVSYTRLN